MKLIQYAADAVIADHHMVRHFRIYSFHVHSQNVFQRERDGAQVTGWSNRYTASCFHCYECDLLPAGATQTVPGVRDGPFGPHSQLRELEVLLNYDPSGPVFEPGDRMLLSRLKLAIKHKQKKFCAHPNVQQLLASIWYDGLPGFRRKNVVLQCLEICRIGLFFPVYSVCYILAPHSTVGRTLRKPFIKFICHSASYVTFLFLLILASQRIESVLVDWFGTDEMKKKMKSNVTTKTWSTPSDLERDKAAMGTGADGICRRHVEHNRLHHQFPVRKEILLNTGTAHLPREKWDAWDPILIAEGLFATANIFSSLKLVYIFSVNPHLGPLQICLGRMVIDIVKFFFVYTLVLFRLCLRHEPAAVVLFGHGEAAVLLQPRVTDRPAECLPQLEEILKPIESSQTLFWASFGLIELDSFELTGIQTLHQVLGPAHVRFLLRNQRGGTSQPAHSHDEPFIPDDLGE
ncbi:transient receptor potential-gamma protein [Caerostris extrusa]|uniref:Transient receptor potential-gamma protein n=1 Tax=Caerostris extrusa TaxID=172846 RepID=A0AAV4QLE6_CAEEX|nr:transient receptor potential-gamma protein [Caerostris extrusa]